MNKEVVKDPISLTAMYSQTPDELQLSSIAISDNGVQFTKKLLAQGNQFGEIVIWKRADI